MERPHLDDMSRAPHTSSSVRIPTEDSCNCWTALQAQLCVCNRCALHQPIAPSCSPFSTHPTKIRRTTTQRTDRSLRSYLLPCIVNTRYFEVCTNRDIRANASLSLTARHPRIFDAAPHLRYGRAARREHTRPRPTMLANAGSGALKVTTNTTAEPHVTRKKTKRVPLGIGRTCRGCR